MGDRTNASAEGSLEDRLAAYLSEQLPGAEDVRVVDLERISGGASRETYRFVLAYREEGEAMSRRFILRRDPSGSLIETERTVEFAAYRAFHGTPVPVPETLWLEEEPKWLDYPFFIMKEIVGMQSNARLASLRPGSPALAVRARIAAGPHPESAAA